MPSVVRAVLERSAALFAGSAALELEAECLARHAERQAELLRLADRYADEGLYDVAARLRRQAEEVRPERPLAGVLPSLSHLGAASAVPAVPAASAPTPSAPSAAPSSVAPAEVASEVPPPAPAPAAVTRAPARLTAARNGRNRRR
jgi:hypothetical protein